MVRLCHDLPIRRHTTNPTTVYKYWWRYCDSIVASSEGRGLFIKVWFCLLDFNFLISDFCTIVNYWVFNFYIPRSRFLSGQSRSDLNKVRRIPEVESWSPDSPVTL